MSSWLVLVDAILWVAFITFIEAWAAGHAAKALEVLLRAGGGYDHSVDPIVTAIAGWMHQVSVVDPCRCPNASHMYLGTVYLGTRQSFVLLKLC